MRPNEARQLAINGGPKAYEDPTGKVQPKIGVAEFLSIAKRFGFPPDAFCDAIAAGMNKVFPACCNESTPVGAWLAAEAR